MVTSKKIREKTLEYLVFSFFVVFPFGQLLKLRYEIDSLLLRINILDIVVFLAVGLIFLKKNKRPKVYKYIDYFVYTLFLSFLFSLVKVKTLEALTGFFYLLRIVFYLYFPLVIWQFVKKRKKNISLLLDSLVVSGFMAGFLGLLQYIFLPDLRFLKYLGWDDHLFRLAGTFLDPGFAGIILAFSFCITLYHFMNTKRHKPVFFFLSVYFVLTILLTFSRASYLALLVGFVGNLLYKVKNKARFFTFLIVFLTLLAAGIYLLPKPAGEGVNLLRTFSIEYRLENYRQTFYIFTKYPIFGVGYNNLCFFRQKFFQDTVASHACSGSDSSFLLLLAAGGLVAGFAFFYMVLGLYKGLKESIYKELLLICFAVLLVHSFFVNSLFYPWSMGFLAVLLGVSLKGEK